MILDWGRKPLHTERPSAWFLPSVSQERIPPATVSPKIRPRLAKLHPSGGDCEMVALPCTPPSVSSATHAGCDWETVVGSAPLCAEAVGHSPLHHSQDGNGCFLMPVLITRFLGCSLCFIFWSAPVLRTVLQNCISASWSASASKTGITSCLHWLVLTCFT